MRVFNGLLTIATLFLIAGLSAPAASAVASKPPKKQPEVCRKSLIDPYLQDYLNDVALTEERASLVPEIADRANPGRYVQVSKSRKNTVVPGPISGHPGKGLLLGAHQGLPRKNLAEIVARSEAWFERIGQILKKFALSDRMKEVRQAVEAIKLKLSPREWDVYRDLFEHNLSHAADRGDAIALLQQFGASRELVPAVRVSKPTVLGDAAKAVGHVDVAATKTYKIKQGNTVHHVSAGRAELYGRELKFDEMVYIEPPEGMSATRWAEQLYGVKLQPLRSAAAHKLEGGAATEKSVGKWLQDYYAAHEMALEPEQTFDRLARSILSGKEVHGMSPEGAVRSFRIDSSNPAEIVATKDVVGGFRRIFLHPKDPSLLIKIYDPALSPGIDMMHFARMMQWDLARIDYFNRLATEMQNAGEQPYFRMNEINRDMLKLSRGISEVRIGRGKKLGEHIDAENPSDVPDFVEHFFEGLNKFDEPVMKLGQRRYGEDFIFAHRFFPGTREFNVALKHVNRFKLLIAPTGMHIVHGLDTGKVGEYENVLSLEGTDGRNIPLFIDQ